METFNSNMTAERSLEIISKAIEQSRNQMSGRIAKPLILWGVLVVITALTVGHLWQHCGSPIWNLLWLPMTVVGFILNRILDNRQKTHVTGIVPTLLGHVWLTFCFFAIGTFAAIVIAFNIVPPSHLTLPMTGIFAILMGMATAISGFILKIRLLTFCGIFAGILCLILDCYIDGGFKMLIIAAMAVIGLIIPGVYLLYKTKHQVSSDL